MARFSLADRGFGIAPKRGATGATGPTGATGNGAVFQAVDSLSGTPRSVTDWGTILNTAISGGTRRFVFGPFDYPFTTALSAAFDGITFEGAAGANWLPPGASAGYTRLIWNGTGTSPAIDIHGVTAPTFRDMGISYTSNSFTGKLIDAHGTALATFERCHIGYAAQGQTITAPIGVYCGAGILPTFDSCVFEGSLAHVEGFDVSTHHYCNSAKFSKCVFQGQCQHSIINPGQAWNFDTCIFESVGAADQTVSSHIWINSSNNSGSITSIKLTSCSHWDASSASTTWIKQTSGIEADIKLDHCVENNNSITKSLDLQGNGTVTINGGTYISAIDFGDATNVGSQKYAISVHGIDHSSNFVNLDSGVAGGNGIGHSNIDIGGNRSFQSGSPVYTGQAFRTGIARERADRSGLTAPTLGANAGCPANVSVNTSTGNDVSGTITLQYTGGGTSGTGLCTDVTFAYPPALNGTFGAQPVVVLSPMNDAAAASQGYAQVAAASPGKFTLGIHVGITGAALPTWAYRVMWT